MNPIEGVIATQKLREAVAAVAPVIGVSCGVFDDRGTWSIVFAPEATPAQRAAAQAVLATFDYEAIEAAEATRIAALAADPGVVDLLRKLQTASVSDIDTWLTNNVTNLVQARTVLAAMIKALAILYYRG